MRRGAAPKLHVKRNRAQRTGLRNRLLHEAIRENLNHRPFPAQHQQDNNIYGRRRCIWGRRGPAGTSQPQQPNAVLSRVAQFGGEAVQVGTQPVHEPGLTRPQGPQSMPADVFLRFPTRRNCSESKIVRLLVGHHAARHGLCQKQGGVVRRPPFPLLKRRPLILLCNAGRRKQGVRQLRQPPKVVTIFGGRFRHKNVRGKPLHNSRFPSDRRPTILGVGASSRPLVHRASPHVRHLVLRHWPGRGDRPLVGCHFMVQQCDKTGRGSPSWL